MTAFLEAAGTKRLLSPVPLKTSFIPAHYHFDTSSISQLLMDAERIRGFKNYFEHSVHRGFALPKLTGKATLLLSLATQSGRAAVTPAEEELYKDAMWTYLADFKNRRTKLLNPLLQQGAQRQSAMRFDHSISTDGYSVTLIVTDREVRGRKHVYKSAVTDRQRKKVAKPSSDFPSLNPDQVGNVSSMLEGLGDHCLVGGDPGKTVLLMLIDEQGRSLRYTSAERRHDTLARQRTYKNLRARGRPWKGVVTLPSGNAANGTRERVNPTAARLETELLRGGVSKLTCNLGRLRRYVAFREATRTALESSYTRRVFRATRFTAWCGRSRSVGGFAKRIVEKYGGDNGGRQVVILYGDWGRRPNLKHQAPSPGIGLRRQLHAFPGITTVTVREAYTSSFCPRCSGEVDNARGVHGILKCGEGGCGTWWSRDILGASNILLKGRHLLDHGTPHPLFGN